MNDIDKIELCLHEILMIKEILATQKADDLCARIIAIYAVMRIDDIVKYYEKNLSEDIKTIEKEYSERYHKHFNQLRDKFGAHFQQVKEGADMLYRIEVFRDFNCTDINTLIDDAVALYQLGLGDKAKNIEGFVNEADKKKVEDVLCNLYSDGDGMLSIGTLDLFAPNKGSIITMSKPQQKVQHLRSLEVIEDIVYHCVSSEYGDASVKMMFKRMYINTVVNFYDNLVTRNDVSSRTNRGELGLDKLYQSLYCPRDNREKTENAFEMFENKYNVSLYFSKIRTIRNQGCAHLTGEKSSQEIDALLNSVDLKELKDKYSICQNLLKYLVCNIFLLKFMGLPTRNLLPSTTVVTMEGQVDFYGRPVKSYDPNKESLTPERAWRIVRKGMNGCKEAEEYIKNCLFCNNNDEFNKMFSLIVQRLNTHNLDQKELSMICKFLINAKRGYPERLQDSLLSIFHKINKDNQLLLIYIISNIAVKDKDGEIVNFIYKLNSERCYILSTFAALTAMRISIFCNDKNGDSDIIHEITNTIDSVKKPTEHLSLVISLCNHWFESEDYIHYHKSNPSYGKYLLDELHKSIEVYCSYTKADEKFSSKLHNIADSHRFCQLQYECGEAEKDRNQKTIPFWNLSAFNCMITPTADEYETMYAAMLYERVGYVQYARKMLEQIKKDFPLSDDVQSTYEEFCRCHP